MIKVLVLVEKQYDNVQEFMKNENFGFRFHKFGKDELIFSVFNLDPISRSIENIGFFNISNQDYDDKFKFDEMKLREYVSKNPDLVREEEQA